LCRRRYYAVALFAYLMQRKRYAVVLLLHFRQAAQKLHELLLAVYLKARHLSESFVIQRRRHLYIYLYGALTEIHIFYFRTAYVFTFRKRIAELPCMAHL